MVESDAKLPRVVIIGGGFGGLQAAFGFKKAPCSITLIDKSNHHLFQPLLYQVATAALSPGDIAAPIRQILKRYQNTEVVMSEVTGVDTATRNVVLQDGAKVPFDYLIIATGANHSYFGHEEWEVFAPGLKSISDATTIRRNILLAFEEAELEQDPAKRRAQLTMLIVGAGPTGVELAGSIAELASHAMKSNFRHFNPSDTRIILVEAGPRILAQFPQDLAAKAKAELESLGVEVMTETRVEQIDDRGVTMGGKHLEAKTIIWAAGVQASPAGKWLNAEMDKSGRVKVNNDLSVPRHPNIFVIGDTAMLSGPDGKPLPGVATVAMQEGQYVASLIRKKIGKEPDIESFHFNDKGSLATIGRGYAIAFIKKMKLSGVFAWFIWLFVHILYLTGFRNRIVVLLQWAWAYVTYERGVRLIVEKTE